MHGLSLSLFGALRLRYAFPRSFGPLAAGFVPPPTQMRNEAFPRQSNVPSLKLSLYATHFRCDPVAARQAGCWKSAFKSKNGIEAPPTLEHAAVELEK